MKLSINPFFYDVSKRMMPKFFPHFVYFIVPQTYHGAAHFPPRGEVFGLHGLGKFSSFGRSLGGWGGYSHWGDWYAENKKGKSTGERNLLRWSNFDDSLAVAYCRYSISGLGALLWKGEEGEKK